MKSDACKVKAKEIVGGDVHNPYVGFAAVSVASVRTLKSEVTDSREEFCAHAHISHGVVVPEGEPLKPELNLRIRALNEKARLLLDPAPESEAWTGQAIEIQAQPDAS